MKRSLPLNISRALCVNHVSNICRTGSELAEKQRNTLGSSPRATVQVSGYVCCQTTHHFTEDKKNHVSTLLCMLTFFYFFPEEPSRLEYRFVGSDVNTRSKEMADCRFDPSPIQVTQMSSSYSQASESCWPSSMIPQLQTPTSQFPTRSSLCQVKFYANANVQGMPGYAPVQEMTVFPTTASSIAKELSRSFCWQ